MYIHCISCNFFYQMINFEATCVWENVHQLTQKQIYVNCSHVHTSVPQLLWLCIWTSQKLFAAFVFLTSSCLLSRVCVLQINNLKGNLIQSFFLRRTFKRYFSHYNFTTLTKIIYRNRYSSVLWTCTESQREISISIFSLSLPETCGTSAHCLDNMGIFCLFVSRTV